MLFQCSKSDYEQRVTKGVFREKLKDVKRKEVTEPLRKAKKKMGEQITRIKRELVHSGAILDIYKDTMELPNGKTEEWDFVSHRKGAAAVVAVREDGKLLMVRQDRPSIDRVTLEIPAGARDSVTEDTKVTAARELEEETGYRSANISFLISLKTTVAFCDEFVDVYLARNLEKTEQHLDEAEDIEVEAWDLDDLCEMIYQGRIQDAKTVAAILAYKNIKSMDAGDYCPGRS